MDRQNMAADPSGLRVKSLSLDTVLNGPSSNVAGSNACPFATARYISKPPTPLRRAEEK
jgi:hypothetical protein